MPEAIFESLLAEADAFARLGEWQATWATLRRAAQLNPRHAGTLTGLGASLLHLNRLAEALPYFEQAASVAAQSPEAHNNLGVARMLAGNVIEAEAAFQSALAVDDGHVPAWKNLALLYLRHERAAEGVAVLAALVQSQPDDVEALMLLAECYEQGGEIESARTLYTHVLDIQPQHAEAIAAIARLDPSPRLTRAATLSQLAALKSAPASIVVIGTEARLSVAAEALRARQTPALTEADLHTYEVFVFGRVHLQPPLAEALSVAQYAGKRVVVDVGDEGQLSDSELARLRNVDAVAVATPAHAERLGPSTRRVAVIPSGWSRTNPLWHKSAPRRATFNVGWIGQAAGRADLAAIKADLLRFLREYPQTQLVIANDAAAWESFDPLPETRRLFLPAVPPADQPFILSHFDVLLSPERDDAVSDGRLMQAGVRGIPWVAAPRAAARAWATGGLLAEKPGEWYAALKRLMGDAILCAELGGAGRLNAETRECAQLAGLWWELIVS
jgi:Flp pilus assembly protein TadD